MLKVVRVAPVFKGGAHDKLVNYRPISILPSLSKIVERLMCNRLLSFNNKYNLSLTVSLGSQESEY